MASWWQNLGSSTTGSKSRKGGSSGTPYSNLGTPDFVTSTGGTSAPTPSRFGVPDFVQQPIDFVQQFFPSQTSTKSTPSTSDYINLAAMGIGGLGSLIAPGLFMGEPPVSGYQGSIPRYRGIRSQVPGTFDPTRRPGSGGQRYFTDMQFVPEADKEAAMAAAATEAKGLQSVNLATPAQEHTATTFMAEGGIATAKKQGMYLDGATDGMADEIPAMIDGEQPAMLSDGEFVIPADVVSHLGNGNSDAGAKTLENMMDEVRMARTGTKKQAPEIDPEDFLPT